MAKDKQQPQKDRFKEAAKLVGADESTEALDRAFGRLSVKRKGGEETPPPPASSSEDSE